MDHDRPVLAVVRSDIRKVEPLRKLVIHLHGAKLPLAPDDILDHEIDLRTIERRLARLQCERHTQGRGRIFARLFRLVPLLGFADILGRVRIAQAHTHAVLAHAQRTQDDLYQFQATQHLGRHLLLRAEQVGIILRKTANAGHATQFARLLPAIHRAKFRQADRQVAVAALLG